MIPLPGGARPWISGPRGPGLLLALALALGGCSPGDEARTGPPAGTAQGSSAPRATLRFRDATEESGLGVFRQENGNREKPFIIESIGAGLALFDPDGDGDLDCYFTNGSSLEGFGDGLEPRDALFLNDGAARFVEGTDAWGLGDRNWTFGARAGDYDGDGRPDLYLTNFGANVLLRNEGGSFADVTGAAGVGDERWGTGAAFLDHDNDGDLDLYVANYLIFNREAIVRFTPTQEYQGATVYFGPAGLRGQPDVFYENTGDGRFADTSAEVGIAGPEMHGFEVVAFDEDTDGWCDVYVANDSHPNLLWRNRGDGTFEDVAGVVGLARSRDGVPQAGMGVALGDVDGGGGWDLLVTNFSGDYDTLYLRRAGGFYDDATHRVGLATPTFLALGWGCALEDFDHDGDRDAFVANGHVYPQVDLFDLGTRYRQPNQVFENDGRGSFRELDGGAGGAVACSRGLGAGDLDGDGDVDLVISNLDEGPTLLLNESPRRGAWLGLLLVGDDGVHPDAVGSRVEVSVGERVLVAAPWTRGSFLSSGERGLHFGLGEVTAVDGVTVRWPGGRVDTYGSLAANRRWELRPGGAARERH